MDQLYFHPLIFEHQRFLRNICFQLTIRTANTVYCDHPIAFAWAGFNNSDMTIEEVIKIGRIKSLQEIITGVQKLDMMALSFVFATVNFLKNHK